MPLARRSFHNHLKLTVAVLCAVLALAVCACNTPPAPTTLATGKPATATTVRELMDHSADYADRTVNVTGTIVIECPEGCWFFLDDGTGKLYIDLQPAGLSIPQKIGSRVTLSGKLTGSGGNLKFLGEDVQFVDQK